ncbi:MAG: GIY-YIG nuclease family protein, partial [Smithellaceae bacterium]|nr:GIY-YIG nuclease family protein [Smithellaceae bacterium]
MENAAGYIYILTSPKIDCVKIGGTDYPPLKRINEINMTEPYKSLGPWSLADFRQVKDWRKIEYHLHYSFRSCLSESIDQQKELFHVPVQDVTKLLNEIDPEQIINKPKIDRMFQDENFLAYITNLFVFSGLMNWLNIQGAWTFVLFPSTSGGRYFTINIGPHEVAFSTLGRKGIPQKNMIL